MAISFIYEVVRMDGTAYKVFRNQKKAEDYALSIKRGEDDKIQITRSAKGFVPYVYCLYVK